MKPVVGMLVSQSQITFLNNQSTSRKSIAIARSSQLTKIPLYLFGISDVNLNKKRITGTYFNLKSGHWTKARFSYPDVLYERIGTPSKRRKQYQQFRQQLKDSDTKILNGPSFNKWKVLNILKENSNLSPHLPATIICRSLRDVRLMLKKHGEVYLKACRGRKGQQVIKVKKMPGKLFEYRYFRQKELHKDIVSFNGLTKVLRKFFGRKSFIIQKAIDLPQLNDCICDMRAEVQRNGKGELEIVEILVRVSQPGAPITQHASSYLFNEFLRNFGKYSTEDIDKLKEKVKNFLAEVYTSVEAVYGPYCEIGIDFAIDKKGELWFIECNSRPAKVSLIKAANNATIQRAFSNPLKYAKFIYDTAHNKKADSVL